MSHPSLYEAVDRFVASNFEILKTDVVHRKTAGDRKDLRTATTPLTPCLSPRVHCTFPPSLASPRRKELRRVVGVVADTKLGSRDELSDDQWYMPGQQPAILFGFESAGRPTGITRGFIVLRSVIPAEQMTQTLRSAVAQIDPLLVLRPVQPTSDAISNVEAPRQFNTDLITAFALGSLLLAITGIYAVVTFSVSLRTQEIAIRMALGAQRVGIARLVLMLAAKMALLGCVLGVLGSVGASRLVRSFLFEVSATDPLIYIGSVLIMMLMALVASAFPATRAASADPIRTLRSI